MAGPEQTRECVNTRPGSGDEERLHVSNAIPGLALALAYSHTLPRDLLGRRFFLSPSWNSLCFLKLLSDVFSFCTSTLWYLQGRMRRWSLSDSMPVLPRVSSNPAASIRARTMSGQPGSWSRALPKKVMLGEHETAWFNQRLQPVPGGGFAAARFVEWEACDWVHCAVILSYRSR